MKTQFAFLVALMLMTNSVHAVVCWWQDRGAADNADYHAAQINNAQARKSQIDKLIATKNTEYEAVARAHGGAESIRNRTTVLESRLRELSAAVVNFREVLLADESARKVLAEAAKTPELRMTKKILMSVQFIIGSATSSVIEPVKVYDLSKVSYKIRGLAEPLIAAAHSFSAQESTVLQLDLSVFDEALAADSAEAAKEKLDQTVERVDAAVVLAEQVLIAQNVNVNELDQIERQAFVDLMSACDLHRTNEIFIRNEQAALNYEIAKRGERICSEPHYVR